MTFEEKLEKFLDYVVPRAQINGFVFKKNNTYHLERIDPRATVEFEYDGTVYQVDKDVSSPLMGWKPHAKKVPFFSKTTFYTKKGKRNKLRYLIPDKEYAMYWVEGNPVPQTPARAKERVTWPYFTPALLKVDILQGLERDMHKSLVAKLREAVSPMMLIFILAIVGIFAALLMTGTIKL